MQAAKDDYDQLVDHLEAKGAGHYGIFSGRRWRDVVYPHVKRFILEHNQGAGKYRCTEQNGPWVT